MINPYGVRYEGPSEWKWALCSVHWVRMPKRHYSYFQINFIVLLVHFSWFMFIVEEKKGFHQVYISSNGIRITGSIYSIISYLPIFFVLFFCFFCIWWQIRRISPAHPLRKGLKIPWFFKCTPLPFIKGFLKSPQVLYTDERTLLYLNIQCWNKGASRTPAQCVCCQTRRFRNLGTTGTKIL